ncbi:MAG: hypothetical protein K2H35_03905 [Muribaculaceae bacterium]|nr:hypothetical protein [Muribaculaceae bacterium]
MNKFLLSLAAVALSSSAVSAADLLYDLQFGQTVNVGNKYYAGNSAYTETFDYKLSATEVFEIGNFNNNKNGWEFIKCGRKGNASTGTITSLFAMPDAVTSVVLGINKFNETGIVNSFTLERSLDANVWEQVATASEDDYNTTSKTLTLDVTATPVGNAYYRISIDCASAKSNGVVWLSDVKYYGEPAVADDREPSGLAFNGLSFIVDSTTKFFSKAVLSNPNNLEVTYTSSNPAVGEIYENISENGTKTVGVRIMGTGTTVITAESPESDTFQPGKVSYTLQVVDGALTIAKMIEKAGSKGDKVFVTGDLSVVFVSGRYVYVTDLFDKGTLLYGNNNYKTGDIIPGGWEAENATYNGLLEWSGSFPEAIGNQTVRYETFSEITEADINRVGWIKGIKFDTATPEDTEVNGKIQHGSTVITLLDGSTFTLYNQFGLASEPAGTYNVLVAVTTHNGNLQLYPCEYVDASTIKEPTFPETLDITTDSDQITVTQKFDSTGYMEVYVNGKTPNDTFTITVATPEGWDGVISMHTFDPRGMIQPLKAAQEADWMPLEYLQALNCEVSNELKFETGGEYNPEFNVYLVYNNQFDQANPIFFYVYVSKDEAAAVEAIDAAEEKAEYYTLEGIKVENPVKGIYVKVVGDKVSKVVL